MAESSILTGVDKKVAQLALEAYSTTRGQMAVALQQANAKLDADMTDLREKLGVPVGVLMNLDTAKDGTMTATWTLPVDVPKGVDTGPIPLKVMKGKRPR